MKNKYKHELKCNKTFDKGEIKKLINWFIRNYGSIRTTKLLDKLKKLGFNSTTKAGISLGVEDLKIPQTKKSLFKNTENELKSFDKKLQRGEINVLQRLEKITKIWNTTNESLKKDLINNFRQTDLLNPVYMMTFSGARGNISQIRQLVGMRGLMSDSQGEIIGLPIKSNLKEGLKVTEYFISCYGARKGLVDTALKTANSGYLTRRLVYVSQGQIIKKPDCNTKNGILIEVNKSNYKFDKEKIIGRILSKDIVNEESGKLIVSAGQDICEYIAKKIIKSRKIYVRSPLTCKLNTGICQVCYGWNLGNGRMVELGESVGIIAAQSIGEPGTQLTMRTFHTGGVFAGEVEETINAPHNGIIFYNAKNGGREIETKHGEKAFLTLEEKKIRISENNFNKSIIRLPKYTILFVKPNKRVFFKQIIAEISDWKQIINSMSKKYKETREIKTKMSGQIYFDKIKTTKEKTKIEQKEKGKIWILSGNILSNTLLTKNLKNDIHYEILKKNISNYEKRKSEIEKNLKKISCPVKLTYKNTKILEKFNNKTILKGKKLQYIVSKKSEITNQILINKKRTQKVMLIKNENIKLGQFIYVNQPLKNNKKSKHCCQIIQVKENEITLRKANPYLTQTNSKITIKNNYLIKKHNVLFQTPYTRKKTEDIVQGLPKIEELLEAKRTSNLETILNNPHEKLKKQFQKLQLKYNNFTSNRLSIQKIQKFLIDKIQSVYESQGVKISDKHMEIIVKQMTSKVIVQEQGDSKIIPGELIELNKIEKINQKLNNKVTYEPILLGISKLSLSNQSFISEASFQETTRILTKSAIEGKIDWLYGLKENIVIGNLIPVGTGYKKLL